MTLNNTVDFLMHHELSRMSRTQTIRRFVRWQVASRLAAGPIVHSWVNGIRVAVSRGDTGMTGNIYVGLHEFEDMAFLLHLLRAGDHFADVGANVGSYSLLAASRGATCDAYEPVPRTSAKLADNVLLNDWAGKIAINRVAVSDRVGVAHFSDGNDSSVNHLLTEVPPNSATIEVPLTTLDISLTRQPNLIKIDVEGFEAEVLRGAARTLTEESLFAVIVEANEGTAKTSGGVTETMTDLGFRPYVYDPMSRRLSLRSGRSVRGNNTLFIRDADQVQVRLVQAPRFTVLGNNI